MSILGENLVKLYPQYNKGIGLNSSGCSFSFGNAENSKNSETKLNKDIHDIKDTFEKIKPQKSEIAEKIKKYDESADKSNSASKVIMAALSPIVPLRRVSSLPDNLKEGNYERALGLLGLAVVNLPEDWRDITAGYNQIFKKIAPGYDYSKMQHPFSFFRGTFLEPMLKFKGETGKRISKYLYDADKTLFDTKFGAFIKKIFKFDIVNKDFIKDQTGLIKKDVMGNAVHAFEVGGSRFGKHIGRALLRIPVLSVIALAALELPAIIKAFNKGKDTESKIKEGSKQVFKSAINLTAITAGIGIAGQWLAKKGPAWSLVGMGIGSVAGSLASKFAGKAVDNVFKTENA